MEEASLKTNCVNEKPLQKWLLITQLKLLAVR